MSNNDYSTVAAMHAIPFTVACRVAIWRKRMGDTRMGTPEGATRMGNPTGGQPVPRRGRRTVTKWHFHMRPEWDVGFVRLDQRPCDDQSLRRGQLWSKAMLDFT
jgi:hypothetical protein